MTRAAGNDVVRTGAGDDSCRRATATTRSRRGSRDDTVVAGAGDDDIDTGFGDDIVYGGPGNDTVDGGPGDDALYGEDGNDVMRGGLGDDILYPSRGVDIVEGGPGDDYVVLTKWLENPWGCIGPDRMFRSPPLGDAPLDENCPTNLPGEAGIDGVPPNKTVVGGRCVPGAEYGAAWIPWLTKTSPGTVTASFVMSTFNPYRVLVMETTFAP